MWGPVQARFRRTSRRRRGACLIDGLGVALAARTRAPALRAAAHARASYGPGPATILAGEQAGDAAGAAFANGVAMHLLDFDDACYAGMVHGTAVLLPALLAVAEDRDASGVALLAAYIAAAETTYALGAAMSRAKHYDRGWFATGCLGAIGAAAGAARLLGGGRDEVGGAVALAAAQAGSLRVVLGSDAKSYLAGRAAQLGVEAARYARSGAGFPWDVFEGRNGFFALFAEGDFDPGRLAELGRRFALLEPGILFKRYPLCSSAQAALEAVEDLMEEHAIDRGDVVRITCALAPFAAGCLPYQRPKSVTEAQFCLPFAVACRLAFGRMTAALLSDATLADPRLAPAMDKVVLGAVMQDVDNDAHPEAARVTIEVVGGGRVAKTCLTARGDPRVPMTTAALEAKFLAAADGADTGVNAATAEVILARIKDIETLPSARDLLAPLRGGAG